MAEFTDEELQAMLQKEGDKRVTEALATAKTKWQSEQQKAIEDAKRQLRQEIEENAKLTAEQLAQKQLEEKEKTISLREREINKKNNRLSALEKLTSNGIPKEAYENMLGLLINEDEATCNSNVDAFVNTYNATKTSLETKIKSELTKVPPPKGSGEPSGVTKETFNKMSYTEKIKFKNENPELYKNMMN